MSMDRKPTIQVLDLVGARLFAVACASRVGLVVRHFGQAETVQQYDAILGKLWILAEQTDGTSVSCEGLSERLDVCPESSIDDPYRRGYYAMRALGVLSDAISAVCAETQPDAVACAAAAADGASSLAADIAFEVRHANPKAKATPTAESEGEFYEKLLGVVESSPNRSTERIRLVCEEEAWAAESLSVIDAARGWARIPSP